MTRSTKRYGRQIAAYGIYMMAITLAAVLLADLWARARDRRLVARTTKLNLKEDHFLARARRHGCVIRVRWLGGSEANREQLEML